MNPKLYLVGGTVRDHFLNLPFNHDIDFAVEADSFDDMKRHLLTLGLKIWQERPEFVTVRGKLPLEALGGGAYAGILDRFLTPHDTKRTTIDADFTLCRAEAMYSDGRHPDKVTPADILTDLSRRDFTCNAIAVDSDGTIIDPYLGVYDIDRRFLDTVGDPRERFNEDSLRILRAIRFSITKKLQMSLHIKELLWTNTVTEKLSNIPVERIREELTKMMTFDTYQTVAMIAYFDNLNKQIFNNKNGLWLKPTTESW